MHWSNVTIAASMKRSRHFCACFAFATFTPWSFHSALLERGGTDGRTKRATSDRPAVAQSVNAPRRHRSPTRAGSFTAVTFIVKKTHTTVNDIVPSQRP